MELGICSSWVFLYVHLDLDLSLRPSDTEPQFCYCVECNGEGEERHSRESLVPFLIMILLEPGKYPVPTHLLPFPSGNDCEGGEV